MKFVFFPFKCLSKLYNDKSVLHTIFLNFCVVVVYTTNFSLKINNQVKMSQICLHICLPFPAFMNDQLKINKTTHKTSKHTEILQNYF